MFNGENRKQQKWVENGDIIQDGHDAWRVSKKLSESEESENV